MPAKPELPVPAAYADEIASGGDLSHYPGIDFTHEQISGVIEGQALRGEEEGSRGSYALWGGLTSERIDAIAVLRQHRGAGK